MVLTAQPRLRGLSPDAAGRLAAAHAAVDPDRLRRDVERLDEPRSRRFAVAGMRRAEAYVVSELRAAGWLVRRRPFTVPGTGFVGVNLVADRSAGGSPVSGDQIGGRAAPVVLVGAHLDTVPGSPGADDNASGVAGVLEMARILPAVDPEGQVRLVVFDEEETGLHGARALAAELEPRPPAAAVILECIGFFAEQPGTQRLPPGAGLLYPGQRRRLRRRGWRGDWTLVAYRRSAEPLARRLSECLVHLAGPHAVLLARDPLDLPLAGPLLARVPALSGHFARSDHKPFWDIGVPAIQVTDTADFRNPHYHRRGDTPDTLDYQRLADIVAATAVATTLAVARPD
jgi:Peptidase family M28